MKIQVNHLTNLCTSFKRLVNRNRKKTRIFYKKTWRIILLQVNIYYFSYYYYTTTKYKKEQSTKDVKDEPTIEKEEQNEYGKCFDYSNLSKLN